MKYTHVEHLTTTISDRTDLEAFTDYNISGCYENNTHFSRWLDSDIHHTAIVYFHLMIGLTYIHLCSQKYSHCKKVRMHWPMIQNWWEQARIAAIKYARCHIKKKANCYSSGNSISSSVSANLVYKMLVSIFIIMFSSLQNFKANLRFSSQVDSMSLSYRVCDLFFRIYKFIVRRKRNLASHLV